MAIRVRRGLEADFDASKMLPGEWAVSTDTRHVRMCVAPGIVKEIASAEEVKDAISKGLISIQEAEENALINISDGVDKTLSVSGKAADAKTTGDKVSQLSLEIDTNRKMHHEIFSKMDVEFTDGGFYHYNKNLSEGLITGAGYSYVLLPVKKGEKYIVRGYDYININVAVLYDEKGNLIQSYGGTVTTEKTLCNAEILIVQDGTMCVNSVNDKGKSIVYKLTSVENTDKFKGKTILFTGDSITNGYGWDYGEDNSNRELICLTHPTDTDYYNLGWVQTFAENHRDTTVYGYGINGAKISGTDAISIANRINSMNDVADYVIFSGGINDCFKEIEIGSLVDVSNGVTAWTDSTAFDINTFYGALEKMFYDARIKWDNAKFGYIITPKSPATFSYDISAEMYYEAIRKACEKWSIPVLDLSNCGNLIVALQSINKKYTMGDTVHPNELCYREVFANQVENFMNSL